jgi:serine/threonine protein kinase
MSEESLFAAVLEQPRDERSRFLEEACGTDAALLQRLRALLAAHEKAVGILDQPVPPQGPPEETVDYLPPGEQVGTVIAGRYKLLEQIGEGGMGTVWVAEQMQPVRRKVALKLIKAGMDSKTVLSRFEAERQALALMDHPNIAKVLDGGTTDSGRPFFVMEYVKGVPFTKYCDDARLSIAERLALFVPVCQAVQHAHQKGIIHRDLKPSNILICLYDGQSVPKVIDFGLAKAMHQPLTEHTLYTGHGVLMGTPLYMSPEQAELNNLDVDTRTDIYALGVILYELLTGTTPLEKGQFQKAAWHEILRLIKETEPPCPSARLSGSRMLPSLAAQRQLEPVKLTRLVRGELDWLVMKCLEKDRSRRYDTATSLARDVERYLADDLVEARPPSAAYRLRKFVRKHRVALATVSAFAVLLLASAGISAMLAMLAKRAEVVAEKKRIEAEWNEKLAEYNLDLYRASLDENFKAYEEAEARSLGLQIDLDLEETRTNPKIGLLRMARTLKMIPEDAIHTFSAPRDRTKLDQLIELMKKASQATGKKYRINEPGASQATFGGNPKMDPLRQFVTMAVLATGQTFAPLLQPITHDGEQLSISFLNSKGDRLLTAGADKTARLWDPFTGRQIAVLRRADEKVINAGLSPDGSTAFTHSLDGVVRLWETKDGAFRAQTEPRPERIKFVGFGSIDPFEVPVVAAMATQLTKLSNDRLITSSEIWEASKGYRGGVDGFSIKSRGPAELWDAKTGRFITRLEQSKDGDSTWPFFGNGRWIIADKGLTPVVLSAENGRPIAKLNHDGKKYFSLDSAPILSPSGRTAATVAGIADFTYDVHCWDTTSWQLSSITGPLEMNSTGEFILISDEFFAVRELLGLGGIYRTGSATPLIPLPSLPSLFQGGRIFCSSGQLFDTRTCRRLQPPKGRKYHPELARLAPDSRFFPPWNARHDSAFIDTATEKSFQLKENEHCCFQPNVGWVIGTDGYYGLRRLPPPDHLEIPPDLLELWAQVAVRGQLDDEGAFVKWEEPTWEKKRQELAAKPAPFPDFPFPGHVAVDRWHWLRAELEDANEKDKPRLAKQLLDRAEAAGDKTEATRWRTWLTRKTIPQIMKYFDGFLPH